MASSSSAEIPRGLEFLLSHDRLNVAMSRAGCLALLVRSPRLLEVDCRTIEHMRLADALAGSSSSQTTLGDLAPPPSHDGGYARGRPGRRLVLPDPYHLPASDLRSRCARRARGDDGF